jgi:hypothetical protein
MKDNSQISANQLLSLYNGNDDKQSEVIGSTVKYRLIYPATYDTVKYRLIYPATYDRILNSDL